MQYACENRREAQGWNPFREVLHHKSHPWEESESHVLALAPKGVARNPAYGRVVRNTLTITQLPDPDCRIQTEIVTYDGVIITEIHRQGLSDAKVLKNILARNYYQHLSGIWLINFPADHKIIQRVNLKYAVEVAEDYIFRRDNT